MEGDDGLALSSQREDPARDPLQYFEARSFVPHYWTTRRKSKHRKIRCTSNFGYSRHRPLTFISSYELKFVTISHLKCRARPASTSLHRAGSRSGTRTVRHRSAPF